MSKRAVNYYIYCITWHFSNNQLLLINMNSRLKAACVSATIYIPYTFLAVALNKVLRKLQHPTDRNICLILFHHISLQIKKLKYTWNILCNLSFQPYNAYFWTHYIFAIDNLTAFFSPPTCFYITIFLWYSRINNTCDECLEFNITGVIIFQLDNG